VEAVADQTGADKTLVLLVVLVVEEQIITLVQLAQRIKDMVVQTLIMTQTLVVVVLVQLLLCQQQVNHRLVQIWQLVRVV
jgi:hypothetical protein